jgi:hypothetical protein
MPRDKSIEQAIQRRREMFEKRLITRAKKCHDYADFRNIYQNFEHVAKLIKELNIDITTPYGCCLFSIILKIDRTCNLLFNGKTPNCESLEDTLAIDLPNYVDLLDELVWVSGFYDKKTEIKR